MNNMHKCLSKNASFSEIKHLLVRKKTTDDQIETKTFPTVNVL